MKRRLFTALAAAAITAPMTLFAGALDTGEPYVPGLVEAKLAEGKTVFVDYSASWCSTCQSQARTINALKAENPAYAKNIDFVVVDWDQYRSAPIAKNHKIPRRSTLIVLKGDKELGRIVAGTSKSEIRALMDTALAAATGS